MKEKEKPRTNPWDDSTDPEICDQDLKWYFKEFDSLCGLQSIGTSGAGENQLVPPTEEEKLARQEAIRNGFLLTLLDHAKQDQRSVSPGDADRAAFVAMAHGVFSKGRRIWKRLTRLPYSSQQLLKLRYNIRLHVAGGDWGPQVPTDEQVSWLHREYLGRPNTGPYPATVARESPMPPARAWQNPQGVPRHLFATLEAPRGPDTEEEEEEILDVVDVMERGLAVIEVFEDD